MAYPFKKDEKKQMIISGNEYQNTKYRLKENIIKKIDKLLQIIMLMIY